MNKIALFAFRGDMTCFTHVLLNALDMEAQGIDVKLILEGEATALIPALATPDNPLSGLYRKVKERGLIHAVCKACSAKMNVLKEVEKEGLPIADEMSGHPSMAKYILEGYSIVTF